MNVQPTAENLVAAAVEFSEQHTGTGCRLDFSLESLRTEVDSVLELPIFFRGREGTSTDDQERSEAALCAYVGETLSRLFNGTWGGDFYPDRPAGNFYTSFVDFGDYRYWPSHFIAYRLTNWPQEGTFANHLEKVLPSIERHLTG
jgi:hypothetical protein